MTTPYILMVDIDNMKPKQLKKINGSTVSWGECREILVKYQARDMWSLLDFVNALNQYDTTPTGMWAVLLYVKDKEGA